MTDDRNLPNTPENAPGNSGSRWEPDPASPVEGPAAAPVPPVDAADGPAYPGAPAGSAPAAPRPSRTRLLTGGLAAAALVVAGGLGLAVGHATAGPDHGPDGVSDVSFQQGDHGLPPGTQNGVPAPGQPGLGDDDDDDDGFPFGDDDGDEGETDS